MTDRDRRSAGDRQDWARQVPWHYGQRGPYEDYGWEAGESVLPEFRDPSVHEMPYDRERFPRHLGQRGDDRQGRPGSAMDAQRRTMMQNPYDNGDDYERRRYGRGYDYEYDRSGRGYNQGRWQGDQGSYGGYDEDRWRGSQGYGGGMQSRSYGGDADQSRWRGDQGYGGGMYNRDYGSSGRGYDEDRWWGGDQGYSGGYGPTTWTYTEYWLIPGPFTGRGPQGYQRSDERIKEDVCERLTQHGRLDASDMQIDVGDGEVTLRGSVDSRQAKRMAEDAAESVSGVREVRNELRVRQDQGAMSGQQGMSSQGSQQREVGGTQTRS